MPLSGQENPEPLKDVDILALSPEMLAFIDQNVNAKHSMTLKLHQLWILNRCQAPAPDLGSMDRVIGGLRASLIRTARLVRSAIVPAAFHNSQLPSSTGEA